MRTPAAPRKSARRPPPDARDTSPDPRFDWLALLAAGVVPLALYAFALHPGLPAGDSGELITVAATGGVAHPPGYPLYALLAGLWRFVFPFGSVAWRLNVFSAVCSAAAASVLALAVRRATNSGLAGVFAAWCWAFSAQAFQYALVAEVFPLNALLAACVLLAIVSPPAAGSVALAGLCALALSHHHTLLLLAAPAFVVSAWRALRPGPTRARLAARMVGAALVGALPLLWLPFAAKRAHALLWGEPNTLRGFLSLLTRAEYGSFQLDSAEAGLHADHTHLLVFLRALPHTLGALPIVLAAVGALTMLASPRWRAVGVTLAASLVAQAWFFTRIGFPADVPWLLGVVERFYILPLLVLAFLAGAGAAWLRARLPSARAAGIAAGAVLLAVALLPLASGRFARLNQRRNRFSDTLGRALLASLPRDAVLFLRGDVPHNALSYLTQVEHLRPDVTVLDQELLTYPWYVRQVRARWPGLLPPLGRAERITLVDGRIVEGLAVPRPGGTVDLLTEDGQSAVPAASIARVVTAPPESLYRATRATFRHAAFLEQGEERYSGFPGTRNLLWLDDLAGKRPVALLDPKENSWALRYALVPTGFVLLAYPRGATPSGLQALEAALAVADSVELGVYFDAYLANGLESPERARFPAVVAHAALLLCQADAAGEIARHPAGYARILEFARRFEPLTPSPDPECLAAIGYLRWVDPTLRSVADARRDLERALSERPALADSARAHRVLAALRGKLQ